MPNYVDNHTNPGDYTISDVDKIEISGGFARIKENLTNVYARWHLNETTGSNVPDDSGNSRNGITQNNPTWVAGLLNNALQFGSVNNQYIDCGAIGSFDYDDAFSFALWAKSDLAGRKRVLIGKGTGSTGIELSIQADGDLDCALRVNGAIRQIRRIVDTNLEDNAWHFIVATYDGSRTVAGLKLYVDTAQPSTISTTDTVIGGDSMIVTETFQVGAQNATNTYRDGILDEVVVFDRVLTLAEIQYLYNSTSGRENFIFWNDTPYVYRTTGFSDGVILSWTNFIETLGGANQGNWSYNLGETGIFANRKYHNGATWVIASAGQYNSAATVLANIATFPTAQNAIWLFKFAISDSFQFCELDENQIGFTLNQLPIVYAGSDKECFDHQTISPFSDCTFSDPDGIVDHAFYKVDGEVDIWTEIFQGAYGTLLEAVRTFQYTYDNIGDITTRLKVRDNLSEESEDDLIVTVKKYPVTFTVQDKFGTDLINITFLAGDGSSKQTVDSPFIHEYEYHAADLTAIIDKAGYATEIVSVEQGISSYSITLRPTLVSLYENMFVDNVIYTNGILTSARIRIYSNPGDVGTDNNVIESFDVTATELNRLMQTYKTVRTV